MKITSPNPITLLVAIFATGCLPSAQAESAQMRMSIEIPPGIETPDRL